MSQTRISAEMRRLVIGRAGRRCEYCLIHEDDTYFGCAGILQSRVEELTERQLRRIERGECRATAAAIAALAKAHDLDANAYMERLARVMPPSQPAR
jgi:hypothetical protein